MKVRFFAGRYRVLVGGYMFVGPGYLTRGGARIYMRALQAGLVE